MVFFWWFFEGDVVGIEMVLIFLGWGRLFVFDMEYWLFWLNDFDYIYEKVFVGLFKDFVLDWYGLGYYLVMYVCKYYGKDIWNKVVKDVIFYKGLFYFLSLSLKCYIGLGIKDFYW